MLNARGRRAVRAAVFATVAALVLGAAGAPPATAQQPPVLRVATTPIDIGGQVLWAKEEGFLKKAGVDAEITLINNGAAIAAAVASGAVDIGQANLVSLATAHERGLPFVLIAPGGFYTSTATVAKRAARTARRPRTFSMNISLV